MRFPATDPLDAARIRAAIGPRAAGLVIEVVEACDSTNSVLRDAPGCEARLLLAENQTAGRGRRGRRWLSRAGASLTFSLRRRLARPPRELAALSLAAGTAAARALRDLGAAVALKRPNDLIAGGAKLGGILIETRTHGAQTTAVIGIGLNVRRVPDLGRRLRRKVTALEEHMARLPDRNALAGALSRALLEAVDAFEAHGA